MEKDTKWKTFFEDNRRYADIINGLECGGRQLVSANDLQAEDSTSGKKSRDSLRRVALGKNFVIVGIENQEEPDYGLPFRNMAYDVGVYGKQMRKIHREVQNESAPESLKDMTPDYKVNIIEIWNLKHTEVFQTDVKQVFDFIRLSGDKEALLKLVESDDHYRHMDEDAFDVITTYTNSKELRKQLEQMQQESKKGGKIDMCKAIKDLMADSRTEGRCESIIMLLEDCGSVGEDLRKKIMSVTDTEVLKRWLKLAGRVSSIEEFEAQLNS